MSATSAARARGTVLDDAVIAHLTDSPTVGLRELGKAVGVGRTAAHRSVRRLVAAGALTVVRLGTCADEPSTYDVTAPGA